MSTSRRTSVAFKPKILPYKIDFASVAAGKTIAGSKRKMTWKFGWTDSEAVHEVSLIHSIISGKKTVFEDGKEVTVVHAGFNTDFSHGWQSGDHMFRVAIDLRLSDDPSYEFTIDGARFIDFQQKPFAVVSPAVSVTSSMSTPHSATKNSRTVEKRPSATFDPFKEGDNTNSSSDAFDGSFGSPATAANPPAQVELDFFHSPTPPVPPAASVPASDFFFGDDFGATAPVTASSKPPAAELFDLFSTPTPVTVQSTAGSFTDPFSSPPAASSRPQGRAGGFDSFGQSHSPRDPFTSSSSEPSPFDPFNQGATGQNGSCDHTAATVTKAAVKPAHTWEGLVDLNLSCGGSKNSQPTAKDNLHTGPSLAELSSYHPTHATSRPSSTFNSSDPFAFAGGGQQPMSMGRSGMGQPSMGGMGMGGMGGPPSGRMGMGGGSMGGMGTPIVGHAQSSGYGIGSNRMGGSNMTTAGAANGGGGGMSSLDDLVWKK